MVYKFNTNDNKLLKDRQTGKVNCIAIGSFLSGASIENVPEFTQMFVVRLDSSHGNEHSNIDYYERPNTKEKWCKKPLPPDIPNHIETSNVEEAKKFGELIFTDLAKKHPKK